MNAIIDGSSREATNALRKRRPLFLHIQVTCLAGRGVQCHHHPSSKAIHIHCRTYIFVQYRIRRLHLYYLDEL